MTHGTGTKIKEDDVPAKHAAHYKDFLYHSIVLVNPSLKSVFALKLNSVNGNGDVHK